MVRYGTSIISERKKFISRLNDILSEIHQNLTGGKEQILITYEPNVSEEAFSEELKPEESVICVSDSPTPGRTGTISVCGSTTLISVNTFPGAAEDGGAFAETGGDPSGRGGNSRYTGFTAG